MALSLKLEQFEGPLDLLLQLVEAEKVDITAVSLSRVTEQYLQHLEQMADRSGALADFLVVGARLVYLKSRTLVPSVDDDEDGLGGDLAKQLKLYKRFIEAAGVLSKLWNNRAISFVRPAPPATPPTEVVLPPNLSVNSLRGTMGAVLARLKPVNPLPSVVIDRTITVRDRIQAIVGALRQARQVGFWQLCAPGKSRSEVVIGFLAILELLKKEQINFNQAETFSEIMITIA